MAWKHDPVPYDEWTHNTLCGLKLDVQPVGGVDLSGLQEDSMSVEERTAKSYAGPAVQVGKHEFGYLTPRETRLYAMALQQAADEAERRGGKEPV